jgi:hypothetical protein
MPSFRTVFSGSLRQVLAVALPICLAAAPASAQQSREEEIATQQAEKAKSPGKTTRNAFEQTLLDIEDTGGLGVQRGWFVAFGDIKSGSGIALGPLYGRTLPNGAILQAKGTYSIRNFKMAQFFAQAPPLADGRLVINGRVRWQDAPVLPVYALGTDSTRTRADYTETMSEISGQALFRPVRLLRFAGGTAFEGFDTGGTNTHGRSSVDELFSNAEMPGILADPDYLHSYVSAAIDSRRSPGFSRSGTYLGVTLHEYRQQNTGPYSFRRTDAKAQQMIPILHGNWVIDLSLRASVTSTDGNEEVPFFLMPSLGGGSALRGYGNYRFRGRNSLLFTGEYRWYAQEYVEMAVFYDAGKVTARRQDLDFDGMKSDVGIGIRFHGPTATFIRAEVARGSEGLRFILSFSPIGQ